MNRKQLVQPNNSLMRRESALPDILPMESEEAGPNILASIWRHRWAVLAITVVLVIGAVIFLRLVPPSFTATSQLTIDPPPSLPQLTAIASPIQNGDTFLWTQVAIMESPAVCGDAAKTLRPDATADDLHTFTNELRKNLNPDVGHKDSVISLEYTDKSADDAASNVNAIVDAYIKYVTKTHGDTSHALINVLVDQEKKYQDQLSQKRDEIIDFRKQHPELQNNGTNGVNVVETALARLFDARTTAVLQESQNTAAYNTAEQLGDDLPKLEQYAESQNFKSTTTDEIAATRKAISDAETQLMLLKGQFPDKNPFVQREALLVAELNAKLQILTRHFADEFMASLEQSKVQAEEQVKAIDDKIKEYEKNVAGVNTAEGDLMKLQNAEAGLVKLVGDLDASIKSQDLSALNLPNIRVLQPASGIDATRTPEPSRVLVLTLAMGLAIGSAFALLREKLDHRVRSPEEIAGRLGLPVVGIVPHMKRGLTPLARAQAVHWDPMSEVAESYRAVRTAIHFGVPAGQARTIVITSPTPGDGKSTLASNLAISMAQAGKRTLLLDADFRRPVQHRMFELKDESGLTAVLAGQESLSKAIRRTVVEGLDLLPAGPLPLNPSELLNGESFANILEELMQKYDHIILDCTPVVAVTDARILGAVCDLSLLVLRAGKTTRQGAELARTGLLSVGARLLGVVVNDVPRGEEQYGYYGSYAYRGGGRNRLPDENGSAHNGHSSRSNRRLPSPSDVDAMQ